jgi:hypothetical protein
MRVKFNSSAGSLFSDKPQLLQEDFMGAHPYWYYTPYQLDLTAALQALRKQEFQSGRYNPVVSLLQFPITDQTPSPGAQHFSIEAALEAADAEGTRSILDISRISDIPYPLSADELDLELLAEENIEALYSAAFPLASTELITLFGTEQPTHKMIESVIVDDTIDSEAAEDFWDSIDRGSARYIIVYEESQPTEIFFVGYSFD